MSKDDGKSALFWSSVCPPGAAKGMLWGIGLAKQANAWKQSESPPPFRSSYTVPPAALPSPSHTSHSYYPTTFPYVTSPLPVAQPNEPLAEIKNIWIERDIALNLESGMIIHSEFDTHNLGGRELQAISFFYNGLTMGNAEADQIKTTKKGFRTASGHLCCAREFTPRYEHSEYGDFELFLPYSALPYQDKDEGEWPIKFSMVIRPVGSTSTTLARSGWETFSYYVEPNAEIERTWTDHNVERNGEPGMVMHAKLHMHNLEGKKLRAISLFLADENTGVLNFIESVRDGFRTTSGQLCSHREFTPTYRHSIYNDFELFLPYSAFPFKGEGKWPLSWSMIIDTAESKPTFLVGSAWNDFICRRGLSTPAPT